MDEEEVKPCIQDRFKEFIRSLFSIKSIIFIIVTSILIYFSLFFGMLNLFNIDASRLMVEVEATILGFYGLIYVSVLNSMDTRLDQQLVLRKLTDDPPSSKYPHTIMVDLIKNREKVSNRFNIIFFYIITSMVLGIASVGIYNVEILKKYLYAFNIIGVCLFLYSFYLFGELMLQKY